MSDPEEAESPVAEAIATASRLIDAGDYARARAVLAPYADDPQVAYWRGRIDRRQAGDRVVTERPYAFIWLLVIAVGFVAAFALVIAIIGLTA